MIKFFRKIRQKLLAENNFTKYLLYAVGEIVLVVIGILIALQINNRNEFNKNRKKEALLLQQMKTNLQSDQLDLEFNIENNRFRIECNQVLIRVIEEKIPYHDSLRHYFGNFFGNFQLSENTSAWENLKSVGFDLISDDSLLVDITDLYSNKYDYLENLEKDLDDRYQWDYLYPQTLKHIKMDELWSSAVPNDYDSWLGDNEFYEVIKLNLTWRYYMQDQYESNYKLVLALQKRIERHLQELDV